MLKASRMHQDGQQDEVCQSSFLFIFLDRISCGPTQVVDEPLEVSYVVDTKAQQPIMQSPPILYVHRYQTKPESRDPAPLPTIKSCDTDTTANNSDDDSSCILQEDQATLNSFDQLAGRATPVISNMSSSYLDSPRSVGLRKCHCFDEEDMTEAPHAQAIVIDNRDLLMHA